ncbi:MAG: glycoside hydrolase family 9 protein [Verrucomicrobiota bacterium]|jgi:endoglucanase
MRIKIALAAMCSLTSCLWTSPDALADIALQDGTPLTAATSANSSSVSTSFTVTTGAQVLVVLLYDRNQSLTAPTNGASPSSLSWGSQTITRVVSQNNLTSHNADSDIYFLWNPTPGTQTITATDTTGQTPSAMTMQVFTLNGVDTTVAPATYGVGDGDVDNVAGNAISVTLAGSTPGGAWAVVNASGGDNGAGLAISSSSGVTNWIHIANNQSQAMGVVQNLASGVSMITASDPTHNSTQVGLAVAVFSPLLSAGTNAVTPQFSSLTSQTINYGAANVLLTGTVGTSSNSPPDGTPVSVSVGGVTQSGTVYDTAGDFSINYDAVGIPTSATPYTVTYTSSIATGFNSATNTSTTMTVNALPVVLNGFLTYSPNNTTTVPASDLYVANLVGSDNLTLLGSVTIASTNVGVQPITSFSGLTLGGSAAANYTLTGATGTVTITSAVTQTNFGITDIRTASPTELVAFYTFTNVTGPVWGKVYPTNLVTTSQPSQWKLNGTPVEAISGEFVTEANAVEYHIYLQVPQLVNGTSYTLVSPFSTNSFVFEDSQILCESIHVNQSGYSALSDVRYANLAVWLGTGGAQPISGPLPTYTIVSEFTGQPVASGTVQAVPTAQPDTSSGDYVYRMDLSSVPPGGPYRVIVSGYGSSYPFGVGGNFSSRLAYVAFRGLYYQRCGCPIIEPYAWANLRPYPCHTNIYDDENSSDNFSSPASTSGPRLDVHGGYHDASNPPRYAYHLEVPMVLMTTYEAFPQDFTSNQFNIPVNFDSAYNILPGSNGIPDLLNEVNWGLMFFTNVQSTPDEPVGAIPFGVGGYNAGAPWGDNMDQDTTVYSTITNVGWDCGLAAGAFMNYARLIQPYNAALSANFQARGVAAYNAAAGRQNPQEKLYYAIQYYLLSGDITSSNYIEANYTQTSAFPSTYNDEVGGIAAASGRWMASYFMSYLLATNRPTDPTVVAYFKSVLQQAADKEVGYVTNDAYPCGWPTNANPYTQYSYFSGAFTSQGQFCYPCLMEWALTGTQKYIDAVSQLMDYDQGLNPIGKCYMTGLGFNQVHNPEQFEYVYAEAQGWGGPQPGVTVYGPGTTQPAAGESTNGWNANQIPNANFLPRERVWVDDLGNFEWCEFTVGQCECWPAAIYTVLAQGSTWRPAIGEPYLYHGASITPNRNGGYTLQFGGLPYQAYSLQAAPSLNGPWTTVSGPVTAGVTGMVQFTHNPNSAQTFYRALGQTPIY